MKWNRRLPSLRGETLFVDEWPSLPYAAQAAILADASITTHSTPQSTEKIVQLVNSIAFSTYTMKGGYLDTTLPADRNSLTLPAGYGIKGGAARALLAADLSRKVIPPRDLDVIRVGQSKTPQDELIAQQFMPYDFIHGSGVEVIRDLATYFETRDLTVNEVAVFGSSLTMSIFAALDTLSHTIRASRYRSGTLKRNPALSAQILLKMLRLRAEYFCAGEHWRLVGVPQDIAARDVDIVLHLEKAFQRGMQTAEVYLQYCSDCGLIPNISDPLLPNALREFAHFTVGSNALLRSIPSDLRIYTTIE